MKYCKVSIQFETANDFSSKSVCKAKQRGREDIDSCLMFGGSRALSIPLPPRYLFLINSI